MRLIRKHSLRITFSKRDLRTLLLLALLMVVALLYGFCVGLWSLHKEEEKKSVLLLFKCCQAAHASTRPLEARSQ